MKKALTLLLTAVTLITVVLTSVSCGGYKGYDFEKDTELVMATNANFPPYEYKDGEKIVGIDVEIAQALATKLGKTLRIEDVDFGSVLTGVETGKYDMALAGITVTPERLKTLSFSDSYAKGIQAMIVRPDSDVKSVDDYFTADGALKNPNMKVGVQQVTTGDIYCSSDVKDGGFNDLNEDGSTKTERVIRYNSGADAVQALISGKVDLVVIDIEPAKSFVKANEGKVKLVESAFAEEDYAIAINQKSTVLKDEINKALKELKADGTIDAIIEKYIPSKQK